MAILELRAPTRFFHPVDVEGYDIPNIDPRLPGFDWDAVEVDLRRCERIHPPAALWCMIYMLLVADRGVDCEVRLPFSPERSRVTITPDDLGLLNLVRIMGELEEFVLPVTRFNSISEVEALENSIIDDLERRNLGAPNVYIDVSVAFAELANNAVEHAQSPIDAYGYVCISNNNTVVVSVADGGIGIKASLQQNPEHAVCGLTDWDAIEYAIQENISGTLDRTRGIGLHHIAYDIVPPDRSMGIYSGTGLVIPFRFDYTAISLANRSGLPLSRE